MAYLLIHFDSDFIVGTVSADNGKSYPILNGTDELLWLYFFNNPHQNRVSFGKDNKVHYNNKEINYYGRFFEIVENEQISFIVRDIPHKGIELLEYSNLLNTIRKKYVSVTHDDADIIPTLITFSPSISDLAKQKTVDYLNTKGFRIEAYTIPLSELVCYYTYVNKEFVPENGNTVLFLSATDASLSLMKLVFSQNYFMLDGRPLRMKGKGIDPRKRALVKLVVQEVNRTVGALSTPEEIEDECERKEQKADEWLRRLDLQLQNRPLPINESLSIMPNAVKQVLIRKENIESDTGHYIQELMDIYDSYKSENVKGDVVAIFLLGDCFLNSLVKQRFEKLIPNDKLFVFSNSKIAELLSVYPKVDFKRYIDEEARSKAAAEAEEVKQAEQRAFDDRKRKEQEAAALKESLEIKAAQNRKDAKNLFERALELDKEGKLEDARVNVENALTLESDNKEYRQLLSDIVERIEQLKAKNDLYKEYLKNAELFIANNDFEKALAEYEDARSVFDNAEITKKINQTRRLLKAKHDNAMQIAALLDEAQALIKQQKLESAAKKISSIISIDPEHQKAIGMQKEIDRLLHIAEQERIAEANTKIAQSHVVDGDKLMRTNDIRSAIEHYKEAFLLCPSDQSISLKIDEANTALSRIESEYNDLCSDAKIFEARKKYADALDCLKKALLLKPNDKILLANIEVVQNILKVEGDPKMRTVAPTKSKATKESAVNNSSNNKEKEPFIVKPEKKEEEDFFLGTSKKVTQDDFLGLNKATRNGVPSQSASNDNKYDNDFLSTQPKDDDDFLGSPKKKQSATNSKKKQLDF